MNLLFKILIDFKDTLMGLLFENVSLAYSLIFYVPPEKIEGIFY